MHKEFCKNSPARVMFKNSACRYKVDLRTSRWHYEYLRHWNKESESTHRQSSLPDKSGKRDRKNWDCVATKRCGARIQRWRLLSPEFWDSDNHWLLGTKIKNRDRQGHNIKQYPYQGAETRAKGKQLRPSFRNSTAMASHAHSRSYVRASRLAARHQLSELSSPRQLMPIAAN
jgi:hypothetical protein